MDGPRGRTALVCAFYAHVPADKSSIYLTRAVTSSYFAFRIDRLSTRLKDQQEERTKTIQQLKDATKYDSTMELIEKYGGEAKKEKEQEKHPKTTKPAKRTKEPQRTNMPPPPTANIVRPQPPSPREPQADAGADFAPNAFAPPAPRVEPQQYMTPETHWYDRIFDVLLGEDETAVKNRFALICQSCRLVNGQAPPGTKSLAEVGMWRCFKCGATNGEVDEGQRIVEEVLAGSSAPEPEPAKAAEAFEAEAAETETPKTETPETEAAQDKGGQ